MRLVRTPPDVVEPQANSGTSRPTTRSAAAAPGPSNAKVECIALASVSFAFERSTNIARRFITGGRISRGNSSITASLSRHWWNVASRRPFGVQ